MQRGRCSGASGSSRGVAQIRNELDPWHPGVQVWNRKTDGWSASENGIRLWKQTGVAPIADLDFHRKNQFYPLRMEVDVSHDAGCEEVFEAIRAGRISPRFRGRDLRQILHVGSGILRPALEKLRRVLRAVIPHETMLVWLSGTLEGIGRPMIERAFAVGRVLARRFLECVK